MEELKSYHNHYYYDSNDIAKALQTLSGAPEEARKDLDSAIYNLQAIAQNDHNSDFYRVFFNVLHAITDKAL